MHTRINLSGNRAVTTAACPYYHYGSQSEKDQHFHNCFESNRNYYVMKWGGEPGQEKYTNPFNNSELSYKEW